MRDDDIDCAEVVREIYTFLDGELTAARRQRIQLHLDDCSPCLEAFDFEAELRQVIALRCREEPPPALRMRIQTALEIEYRKLGGPGIPNL